ncbi:MAG TPA: methyltransferase domain-containing protein [Polyangiaceae bacterium]|nr:methyltransferase domain-containing protein [Polyangiaceae bacterium]
MNRRILAFLVEPVTHSPLRLEVVEEHEDSIEEGRLVCDQSGKTYPIVRGIPRFADQGNYTESFGWQWNQFRDVQIDTETGGQHSRERFDTEAGWTEVDLKDKWVLDAGCGAGRFAAIAAARGARLVAVDYSSAIDAAAETLKRFDNVDLVQASIHELPFPRGHFDFAYCIGVIQHTPDPVGAVRGVVSMVKLGGHFCFTIYGRRPWTKLSGKYLLRPVTKRMSKEALLRAIESVMPVAFPITDVLYRVPVVGKVARFVLPISNYVDRPGFTRERRYREAVLDTFDALSPQYDSPLTADETSRALRDAAATSWTFRSRVPVVVEGTR